MFYEKYYKKHKNNRYQKNIKIAHTDADIKIAKTLVNTSVLAILYFIKCQTWDSIIKMSIRLDFNNTFENPPIFRV